MKFQTIKEDSINEFTEKKSKFIAYAIPIKSVDDVKFQLEKLWQIHPKARHICYAYKLLFPIPEIRINDDGEPSGTAGKPILNQIESFQLGNIMLAVVRYFGGVLLGTGGLIKAYKTAAKLSLEQAIIIEEETKSSFQIEASTELIQICLTYVKTLQIEVLKQNLYPTPYLIIAIADSSIPDIFKKLKSKICHIPLSEVKDEMNIPNCIIKQLTL